MKNSATLPSTHTHTHTHTHTVLGEVDAIKGINADLFARPPETPRTLSVSGRSWGGVVAGWTERERERETMMGGEQWGGAEGWGAERREEAGVGFMSACSYVQVSLWC